MNDLIRILTVSQDERLLESRAALFQKAHYYVRTANDYRQIQSISERENFEVAVLDRIDPASELDELARLIRKRWPKTQILILSKATPPPLDDALYDDCVDAFQVEELFAGVVRLAARSTFSSCSV
ncbi:MAG TPA: hypothetical protein VK638_24915 [Edaphobacter sp.]|nr:hypothetical protein [Edaphobacter sp.]